MSGGGSGVYPAGGGEEGPDTIQNGLALSGSFDTPPAAAAQDERVLMRSTAG